MRLPWRRHIEPPVNPKLAELETAKETLAEIFGIRTVEVYEMIQRRLEEWYWAAGQTFEDGLWPATFCLGE